jgi:hypothetical protein
MSRCTLTAFTLALIMQYSLAVLTDCRLPITHSVCTSTCKVVSHAVSSNLRFNVLRQFLLQPDGLWNSALGAE